MKAKSKGLKVPLKTKGVGKRKGLDEQTQKSK
jgi:hypothetical protein